MNPPGINQYQTVIQDPQRAFLDPVLRHGNTALNAQGMPKVASGGFALTFDVTAAGQRYAVRCFHKKGNRLDERYVEIAEFIRTTPDLSFLIPVDYLPRGILVDDEAHPLVRMPWVAGTQLNFWVEDNVTDSDALDRVRREIGAAVERMRRAGIAHGDLQHGNILVPSIGGIRLVDYDGMYLPQLAPFGAAEDGHRNYQHPERVGTYDDSLDLFSAAVIDLALSAVALNPSLWDEYSNDENMLFSSDDFASPDNSNLFAQLSHMSPLAERTKRLRAACLAPLGSASAILSGGRDTTTPRDLRSSARRITNAPPCILALDKTALLEQVGNEVTVFGRVVSTNRIKSYGRTITKIDFGRYQDADFSYVAFDSAGKELLARFGDLDTLKDSWVSLTGLLSTYHNPRNANPGPQQEIRRGSSLQMLSADQVKLLLGRDKTVDVHVTPEPATQPPTTRQVSEASPGRRKRDIGSELANIYRNFPVSDPKGNTIKPAPSQRTPAPPPHVPAVPPTQRPVPRPVAQPSPPPSRSPWAPPPPPPRGPGPRERLRRWWSGNT